MEVNFSNTFLQAQFLHPRELRLLAFSRMRCQLVALVLSCVANGAFAQYIPAPVPGEKKRSKADYEYWHSGNTFQHLDVSVTAGTHGFGIDLATPLCQFLQLRAGYDYLPPIRRYVGLDVVVGGQTAPQYDSNGNRQSLPFDRVANRIYNKTGYDMKEQVTLEGELTMQNVKVMLDVFPFRKKNWHFTAGLYWGPTHIIDVKNTEASSVTLMCIGLYNQMYDEADASDEIKSYGKIAFYLADYPNGDAYMMQPDKSGEIRIRGSVNRFKPYLGFGYGGRLMRHRGDWKISFDCGALIWGGSPHMIVHDGTDLSRDVVRVRGKLGSRMDEIDALKVYPQVSVRLTKTFF